MAKIFHVNPKTLDVGECRATSGNCPFGTPDDHFTSRDAAQASAESKISTFRGTTPKQIIEQLHKLELLDDEFSSWLSAQKSWTKNEKTVLRLLEDVYKNYDERDREVIDPLMGRISGLHFAKEMLSEKERTILQKLEQVQKRWIGRRKV
jgi:hypothetical protein